MPADIYVRYLRLKGEDVLFIGGSDEHGVPITIKARREGVTPQDIVDRYHNLIKKSFEEFGISFDIYSRTTSATHRQVASDFFKTLYDKDEFITKESEQYYDEEAGVFLADRYITGECPRCHEQGAYGDQCEKCGSTLSPDELINPKSTISGSVPVKRMTKHWYLPLDKHEEWLRKWILEDDVDGGSAMTPAQMRDAGTVTAGTWIWQEKPTKYTVIYHYNDGTGSTNTEKYAAAEAAMLSSTYPVRFNKVVTSWNTAEDGTGTSYELGATIPANTYAIGDVVDLYAIWEDSTAFTNVSEGVYQFQIPGNAQIKLDGLPAGTVYRVSEMLPNGWILVNQSNSSGSIGPLTNSVSTFINKYMPESASAAIYATKTMDGAPATEDMAFEFTLKEGENVIQTVTAANGAVLFDPIIYTSAGTHVYTIVENWETYSGPLDASGVTFDTHVETVTVEVTDDGGGKLSAEVTYDADGPAFANRTNPGDLIITKNVVGQTAANADDTFTFTIRIKSPTGGDINSASIEIGKLPTAEQSPEPTP